MFFQVGNWNSTMSQQELLHKFLAELNSYMKISFTGDHVNYTLHITGTDSPSFI